MADIRYVKDQSPEGFRNFLIEGQQWCGEQKVKWAEIRTLELSKHVILFNLGILAFLGAMNNNFSLKWLLFLASGAAIVSIFLAFVYIYKISIENINTLQARYNTISESIKKLSKNFDEGHNYYQSNMLSIETKLRDREKHWDLMQKASFSCFFLSIILALAGLFL